MIFPTVSNKFMALTNVVKSPRPPKSVVPSSGVPGTFKSIPAANVPNARPAPPTHTGTQKFRELVWQSKGAATLPSKSYPAPKTFGEVTQNLITADRLVKAGIFKTGPGVKTVTRDAFVNAAVNGVVSTPLSIGTYAGSVWAGEQIKGAFTASTPVLPAAHLPAPSQLKDLSGAASLKVIEARLESAELKLILVSNIIQAYAEGSEGKALGKSPDWPTETEARLDMLESQYRVAEENMKLISEENDFIFRPYKEVAATDKKDPMKRLEVLELRNDVILKMFARINKVLEPDAEPPLSQVV